MTILCDTREKKWAHVRSELEKAGVSYIVKKLDIGDYQDMDNKTYAIDRKANLTEVEGNLVHEYERFRRECQRALDAGVKLDVLVETARIRSLEDVKKWQNPRRQMWIRIAAAHRAGKMLGVKIAPHPPVTGLQLYRMMATFAERYNVTWRFCTRAKCGQAIIDLLGVGGGDA